MQIMCGRFVLTSAAEVVAELFEVADIPTLKPQVNICPTQTVGAVVQPVQPGRRELRWYRWGLIPSWAKDVKIGARMFNARAETVADKPSFKSAFRRRRCLIVADGFYEWKKLAGGKQPHLIQRSDGGLMAFAGLWERWNGPSDDAIESCTIITTQPNELLAPIHDRMPVILPNDVHDTWLNPSNSDPSTLQLLLKPYPPDAMRAEPIDSDRFKRVSG